MMNCRNSVIGGVLVLTSAACGGAAPEQAPQTPPPASTAAPASTPQEAAQQVAQGADALAKGFAQMMQNAADGKVTVLPFEALEKSLPEVSGWTRGTPKGSSTTMPFAMSQSEAEYRNGDQRIEISIVDTALNQALLTPMSMFLAAGYSERSSDGFKRGTMVKGEPGFEEWNSQNNRAEVTVVVGKRFVVSAKGRGVSGVEPVRAAVEQVDFAGLLAAK